MQSHHLASAAVEYAGVLLTYSTEKLQVAPCATRRLLLTTTQFSSHTVVPGCITRSQRTPQSVVCTQHVFPVGGPRRKMSCSRIVLHRPFRKGLKFRDWPPERCLGIGGVSVGTVLGELRTDGLGHHGASCDARSFRSPHHPCLSSWDCTTSLLQCCIPFLGVAGF